MSLTCPSANSTTYNDFTITCLLDVQYSDLPSFSAVTLESCIDSCIAYIPDFAIQNGAPCVAVTYDPGNPNSDKCYRKYAVATERTGTNATGLISAIRVGVNGTTVGSSVVSAALSASPTATTGAPLATFAVAPSAGPAPSTLASDSSSSGLSTGATAGLAVGVALGVILIAAVVFLLLLARRRRSKARRQSELTTATTTTATNMTSDGGVSPLTLVGGHAAAKRSGSAAVEASGQTGAQELAAGTEWDSAVGMYVKTKHGGMVEMGEGVRGPGSVPSTVSASVHEANGTLDTERSDGAEKRGLGGR